jgi:hypothetical protein
MRWLAFFLLLTGCTTTMAPYPGFEHLIATSPKLNFDDRFDWVQLRSGEWLKGKITAIREGILEFDSSELGDLEFDWDNVVEVRSSESVTCTFDNPKNPRKPKVVTGRVVATRDKVVVGNRTFKRRDLISAVRKGMAERDYWSGKLIFNVAARGGNPDQTDVGTYVRARRRSQRSDLDLMYRGAFGKASGVETVNNHFFAGQWDLLLGRRWFVTPLRYDVYSNVFQNIRYRHTVGVGGGWRAVDRPGLELDLFGGFGWQFTRMDSIRPRSPQEVDQGVLYLGARYGWAVTPTTDLLVDYVAQVGLQNSSDSTQHFGVVASSKVWGDLTFDVGFYWDWAGQPSPTSSAGTPEKSDYQLVLGVGWDF